MNWDFPGNVMGYIQLKSLQLVFLGLVSLSDSEHFLLRLKITIENKIFDACALWNKYSKSFLGIYWF